MKSTNLIALIIGIVAVVAVIYLVTNDRKDDAQAEPMGVIGHVVEGVGDKIDEGQAEAQAEANKRSADDHFGAASDALGITDSSTQP